MARFILTFSSWEWSSKKRLKGVIFLCLQRMEVKISLEEKENWPGSSINLPLGGMDCVLGTLHVWAGGGEGKGDITASLTQACAVATCSLGSLSLSEPHTQDKSRSGQGCSSRNLEKHLCRRQLWGWPHIGCFQQFAKEKEERRLKAGGCKETWFCLNVHDEARTPAKLRTHSGLGESRISLPALPLGCQAELLNGETSCACTRAHQGKWT